MHISRANTKNMQGSFIKKKKFKKKSMTESVQHAEKLVKILIEICAQT